MQRAGDHKSTSKKKNNEEEEEANENMKASDRASPLRQLVSKEGGDEEMYYAMERFLLLDPKRQIELLGGIEALRAEGDLAKAGGNLTKARISYENAAKVALYMQDKDAALKYLLAADEVSEKEEQRRTHNKLLKNIEEALRISKEYYSRKDHKELRSADFA
jgi:hypothetical protein